MPCHEPACPGGRYGWTDGVIDYDDASSSSSFPPRSLSTWTVIVGAVSELGTLFRSALGNTPYPSHSVFATRTFSRILHHSQLGGGCLGSGTCPLSAQT